MTDTLTRAEKAAWILEKRTALAESMPGLRARDGAAEIGVSEAEWVAARVGDGAVRLDRRPCDLVDALPALGRVMILTRNEVAVHERKGRFDNIRTGGHVGLVLNKEIDLRIFFAHWRHVFAVEETVRSGQRRSLQVFDNSGQAVQKLYLLDESDHAAFDALVGAFRAEDQTPGVAVRPIVEKTRGPVDAVDADAFRIDWAGMQDVHEFHGMLRRHDIDRLDALQLADPRFVDRIPAASLMPALEIAAARALPIMVFVGNRGCIQIHSGPVANLRAMDTWDNVLDPDFNLHVRRDLIRDAFVVRKPTADGIVTALEFYDAAGTHVLQLFGVRSDGSPESEDWRALTDALVSGAEAA